MTWLLPIPASPQSQAKKSSISVKLSWVNMCPTNMNMACCFWLRLKENETSFKEQCILRGDEITRKGVQSIWIVVVTIISIVTKCILKSINATRNVGRLNLSQP